MTDVAMATQAGLLGLVDAATMSDRTAEQLYEPESERTSSSYFTHRATT